MWTYLINNIALVQMSALCNTAEQWTAAAHRPKPSGMWVMVGKMGGTFFNSLQHGVVEVSDLSKQIVATQADISR